MITEDIQTAIDNYRHIETLIPGYKWGKDTEVLLQAAEKLLKSPPFIASIDLSDYKPTPGNVIWVPGTTEGETNDDQKN